MSDLVRRSKDVQITTDDTYKTLDDVYDLRRQLDRRDANQDYIRAEIARLQQLLLQLGQEKGFIEMKLNNLPDPVGEPHGKRYLYDPKEMKQFLGNNKKGAIEGEVVDG